MESISDLPELVAEDFRFGRESNSDLPELVAEDFRFGRESISDLPGERILKCLQNRWILDLIGYADLPCKG